MNKIPNFLIDSSALKDMFESKNKGEELVKKLKEVNDMGGNVYAVTPLASFLRAIWLCEPEIKIAQIQKTLSFLNVIFSTADFKDDKAVMNEIIEVANLLSGNKKNEI